MGDEGVPAGYGEPVFRGGLEGDDGDLLVEPVDRHQAALWLYGMPAGRADRSWGCCSSQAWRTPGGRPRCGHTRARIRPLRYVVRSAGRLASLRTISYIQCRLSSSPRSKRRSGADQNSRTGSSTVPAAGPARIARSVATSAARPGRAGYRLAVTAGCAVATPA